jgi:hypothetical protein
MSRTLLGCPSWQFFDTVAPHEQHNIVWLLSNGQVRPAASRATGLTLRVSGDIVLVSADAKQPSAPVRSTFGISKRDVFTAGLSIAAVEITALHVNRPLPPFKTHSLRASPAA